jgi:hypothetical protein
MKPRQQESTKSYESDGAAKRQPRHDEDKSEGRHNSLHYLLKA